MPAEHRSCMARDDPNHLFCLLNLHVCDFANVLQHFCVFAPQGSPRTRDFAAKCGYKREAGRGQCSIDLNAPAPQL